MDFVWMRCLIIHSFLKSKLLDRNLNNHISKNFIILIHTFTENTCIFVLLKQMYVFLPAVSFPSHLSFRSLFQKITVIFLFQGQLKMFCSYEILAWFLPFWFKNRNFQGNSSFAWAIQYSGTQANLRIAAEHSTQKNWWNFQSNQQLLFTFLG